MNVEIRHGILSDMNEFLRLYNKVHPNTDLKKAVPYFEEKVKNKEIFVILCDKDYAGHACFLGYRLPNKKVAMSQTIAIKEKYRGKGIGKRIIKRCLLYAYKNDVEEILFEVDSKNKPSLKLHLSVPKIRVIGSHKKGEIREILFFLNLNKINRKDIELW